MPTEKDKMLAGALYDAADPALAAERRRARALCQALNALPADSAGAGTERGRILQALFGRPNGVAVTPPFLCDYGSQIELGASVYFNAGCVLLDVCTIRIGDRTLFGPGVHVYAATHPMRPEDRATGLELGRPVAIGSDVWVGGGAIVCPGVTIGDGAVIGAGSVVTRDVPARVFAAGNPCRVIRPL